MIANQSQKVITIELIQKKVSVFFNLTVQQLKSKRKQKKISEPRQIAMFLSRKYTGHSFPEIGQKFGGKNHSTVVHVVKSIEKKIEQDRNVSDIVSRISPQVEEREE